MSVYVIDNSVFIELNRGNEPVAAIVKKYHDAGHQLWVTRATYRELSRIPANSQLAASLGLRVPTTDVPLPSNMRGMYSSTTVEDASALAIEKKATLVIINPQAAQIHRGLGGQVDASYQFKPSTRNLDYNRTRQILGLRPEKFTLNGNLVQQADRTKKPEPAPNIVIREQGRDRQYVPVTKPTTARTGSPIKPVNEGSLNPTPKTSAFGKIGLAGINWIVNFVNDEIQQGRLEEAMSKVRPIIEGTLKAEPSLGVLIRIVFRRRQKTGPENETSLTWPSSFHHVAYEYGYTREEALAKFRGRDEIREEKPGVEHTKPEEQDQWIEPRQPVSVDQLPTPYPSAGLCTFVPGRENLLRVQFSHALGVDEKMKSLISLQSNNASARFLVLFPPNEFKYMWNGSPRKEELELSLSRPAQVVDHEMAAVYLPTLDLDSWINPYDGKAAMVYPADSATDSLFRKQGRIDDKNAPLMFEKMDSVRFVRPQDLRLLKYFGPGMPA